MSWWSGLDEDIYTNVDDMKSRIEVGPESSEAWWPQTLKLRLTKPTAVLARQIASPSYEMMWFTRLARRHGFDTLVIEHRSDQFTVHNPYKRSLATLPIVVGRSQNGRPIMRRQKMVDLAAAEGRRLEEVVTRTGEGLLDYHHRKLAQVLGADTPRVIDLSEIVSTCATGAAGYYLEFLKLFSGRLVLFEDFVADNQTAAFFQSTVLPAYRQAVSDTGRVPQIARLVPGPRTSSPIWNSYPAAVADDQSWIKRARLPEPVAG